MKIRAMYSRSATQLLYHSLVVISTCVGRLERGGGGRTSISILATGNLRRLNSAHLVDPGRGGLNLADGADLVRGVARDADVVATLESQLDIADLEDLATALLRVLASCLEDLVDEVVCDLQDGLEGVSSRVSDKGDER
jgi:hypothetical protein